MRKRHYILLSFLFSSLTLALSFSGVSSGLSARLFQLALSFVSEMGLLGVFVSMTLESAMVPIPSEVVVPLAGFLEGNVRGALVVALLTSVANLLGSTVSYFLGFRLGRLVNKKHLRKAEKFFERFGEEAVFIGRLVPAVRTYISLPAGVGGMELRKFLTFTFLGSLLWNFSLSLLGFYLGENWFVVSELLSEFDLFFLSVFILAGIYFLWF